MHASSPGSAYVQQYMNLGLLMETIFCFLFFQSLSFTLKSRNLQFITGNNYCRCFVCFMVLIVLDHSILRDQETEFEKK